MQKSRDGPFFFFLETNLRSGHLTAVGHLAIISSIFIVLVAVVAAVVIVAAVVAVVVAVALAVVARSISWDDPALSDSYILVFIEKA